MVSKNEYKLITGLTQKKYRTKEGLFIVEGVKNVLEFLQSPFECYHIYATPQFETALSSTLITRVTETELKKMSLQNSPNEVLGIFKIPKQNKLDDLGLIVVLDDIQDPGNMGTIIRLCDWFGVKKVVCSIGTVDCYNPKVVQASMGSLARVEVFYTDLEAYLEKTPSTVFLTLLDGENVYQTKLPKEGILVMGNEANGINEKLKKQHFKAITIPRFGKNKQVESLNVASATAILLSEFRKNNFF